jgi:uncharacterized membrane protein (DUF485 family)
MASTTSTTTSTIADTAVVGRPVPDEVDIDVADLERLASRRFRVALALTGAMLAIYFGFILLIAFGKGFLSNRITDGLTVGMALGVIVILSTWVLTWAYVRWANRVYEPAIREIGERSW